MSKFRNTNISYRFLDEAGGTTFDPFVSAQWRETKKDCKAVLLILSLDYVSRRKEA
jgi:hypothetical protein